MKKILFIIIMLGGFFVEAKAEVNIFACEPEWAALAKEIGGDKVTVISATTAEQDPHQVRAKPSLLAAARKADLIICSGAGLEAGWLPILLEKAGKNVQPGKPGYISAAEFVEVLEKPVKIDRSMGDVHPEGNPHLHLDPRNIAKVSSVVAERLAIIDSQNGDQYIKSQKEFSVRWRHNIARWENEAVSLRGMPIIVHHQNWIYLNSWLGLKQIGSLEPKPGIPPTVSHLAKLLTALKNQPVKAIIRTPYQEAKPSEWLSENSGAPALELPFTVGGKDTQNLTDLFDKTIELLKGVN